MNKLTIALVAAAALASVGCKKKDKAAATEGSGSAAGSGSAVVAEGSGSAMAAGSGSAAGSAAAAPAGACPAGLTASAENAFCFKAPAGMTASAPYDKDDKSRRFDYGDDKGNGVTVVVTKLEDPAGDWDYEVKSLEDQSKKHKDIQKADLPDGGKFMSWVEADGKQWMTVLKKKDAKLLFCRANGKPVDAAVVDACKTASLM